MPPTPALDAALGAIEKVLDEQSSGLDRVRVIATLNASLDELLSDAVMLSRRDGDTWEDIGRALGVSRQAVHQRFSKRPTL